MEFTHNEVEIKRIERIRDALMLLFGDYSLEYRFETSAIGHVAKVYCKQIDKEFDVTDYDAW